MSAPNQVRFSSAQEITELRKRQAVSKQFASGYQPIKNRYPTTITTLVGARANRIPAQQNTCCPVTGTPSSDKPTGSMYPLWNPV
jgi:hypothetical protein